jgi:lysophospholipase L1-like esterase
MARIGSVLLAAFLLWGVTSASAEPVTLVTLGDSLTVGDGDEAGGGYPARLLKKLSKEAPGSTLENLAQSGWTSDDLINTQLEPAVAALRAAPGKAPKLALVWIGSNDLFGLYNYVCPEDYRNDYARCEPEALQLFRNNIKTILASLKATGARLYIALLDDQSKRPVMSNPQLRRDSYDRITADDVSRMSVQTGKYNAVIRELAASYGATTVDFFDTKIFETSATLSEDGNHPNGAGYDAIAGIWRQAISAAVAR